MSIPMIRRNLSVVLTVTILVTIYLIPNQLLMQKTNIAAPQPPQQQQQQIDDDGNGTYQQQQQQQQQHRNIVAYSLMKRIEIEGDYRRCKRYNHSNNNNIDIDTSTSVVNNEWYRLGTSAFFVYSVHVDRRLAPYNYIRIIGMAKGNWNETLHCNLAASSSSSSTWTTVPASKIAIWSSNWLDAHDEDNYMPYLISCQLPATTATTTMQRVRQPPATTTPIKLYLNNRACETASGMLIDSYQDRQDSTTTTTTQQLHTNSNNNNKLTVCVKPLDFKRDITRRLIEWIELNKLLGATTLHFYIKRVHRNVAKLLAWYKTQTGSDIRLTKIDNLRNSSWNLSQKRKYEILTYNDCFYRSLDDAEYIIPLDIDEVIVPRTARTWHDFLRNLPGKYASYSVRNAYYLLNSVSNQSRNVSLRFFQTFWRTTYSDAGESGKSFVSTANTLTLFNHYALDVLKPDVKKCYFIPVKLAQLNHYRYNCSYDLLPECVKYVSSPRIHDDVILKYKHRLVAQFNNMYDRFVNVLNKSDGKF